MPIFDIRMPMSFWAARASFLEKCSLGAEQPMRKRAMPNTIRNGIFFLVGFMGLSFGILHPSYNLKLKKRLKVVREHSLGPCPGHSILTKKFGEGRVVLWIFGIKGTK